eukprot:12566361-Prorocentrum_lima.AAC.1
MRSSDHTTLTGGLRSSKEKKKGQHVTQKLAGGVMTRGAMTQYGEIMPGVNDEKSDIGWTVPAC